MHKRLNYSNVAIINNKFSGRKIGPMSYNKSTTLFKPINYQQYKAESKTQDFRGDGDSGVEFMVLYPTPDYKIIL